MGKSWKGRYFTKFVPVEFLEATLRGELKFGTLAEYKGNEIDSEHRLSDGGEGSLRRYTDKDYVGRSFKIGRILFENDTSVGSGEHNLVVDDEVNCFAFCATKDDYRPCVHKRILAKNPSLVTYVVFDTELFMQAVKQLQSILNPQRPNLLNIEEVVYRDQARELAFDTPEALADADGARMIREAVFVKPQRFEHEEEVRAILQPIPPSHRRALLTKQISPAVISHFKKAVVSHGSLNGDS